LRSASPPAAAIIASQALISGSFTLVGEAMRLNFWYRQQIVYPTDVKGQLYIPQVNWLLLAGCIGVVLFFQESKNMEAAYGLSGYADDDDDDAFAFGLLAAQRRSDSFGVSYRRFFPDYRRRVSCRQSDEIYARRLDYVSGRAGFNFHHVALV
jgi:hypothetical protein